MKYKIGEDLKVAHKYFEYFGELFNEARINRSIYLILDPKRKK